MAKAALIIAVDDYSEERLSALRAPAEDAKRLAQVLTDPTIAAFEVQVLANPDYRTATWQIESFLADRKPDDLLLVYFSCHGVKDANGRLYLAVADTVFGRFASTAISSAWMADRVHEGRSRRVVLMLDCCYSGAFEHGVIARASDQVDAAHQLGGRGRIVISASSATEYSFEGNELAENSAQTSVFTTAVVEGLATGDADRDGDGLVSVEDLYGYVYERVRALTPNQTPEMTGQLSGELYLARSVRIHALPGPLQSMVTSPDPEARLGAVHWLQKFLSSDSPSEAQAARAQLERLVIDDSRRVSDAASAALPDSNWSPDSAHREGPEVASELPGGEPDLAESSKRENAKHESASRIPLPRSLNSSRLRTWAIAALVVTAAGIIGLAIILNGASPTPKTAFGLAGSIKRGFSANNPEVLFDFRKDGTNYDCQSAEQDLQDWQINLIFVTQTCSPLETVSNGFVNDNHHYVVSVSAPGHELDVGKRVAMNNLHRNLTKSWRVDGYPPDGNGIWWDGCSGVKPYGGHRIWFSWYVYGPNCGDNHFATTQDWKWRALNELLGRQPTTK